MRAAEFLCVRHLLVAIHKACLLFQGVWSLILYSFIFKYHYDGQLYDVTFFNFSGSTVYLRTAVDVDLG